jgi:hypothetical protein
MAAVEQQCPPFLIDETIPILVGGIIPPCSCSASFVTAAATHCTKQCHMEVYDAAQRLLRLGGGQAQRP